MQNSRDILFMFCIRYRNLKQQWQGHVLYNKCTCSNLLRFITSLRLQV